MLCCFFAGASIFWCNCRKKQVLTQSIKSAVSNYLVEHLISGDFLTMCGNMCVAWIIWLEIKYPETFWQCAAICALLVNIYFQQFWVRRFQSYKQELESPYKQKVHRCPWQEWYSMTLDGAICSWGQHNLLSYRVFWWYEIVFSGDMENHQKHKLMLKQGKVSKYSARTW